MSNKIPEWALEVTQALLKTILEKDPFTFHHCCRVGRTARRLGKSMGLSDFQQDVLEFSGLFHDIGKVGVPDDILFKPGRLSKEEMDVIKLHPEKSVAILKPLMSQPFFRFLIPGIRFHHERIDGSGYPLGLKGHEIPLTARVVAIVDAVDAMMNTRPYRQGLTMDVVKQELIDFSNKQFDANLVEIYLQSLPKWAPVDDETKDETIVPLVLKAA
ncbi:MAG: HD domain-containing protein [Bdellovibrio sp.]|nr:MAG: HD domain-containing protein [Bdellovibrio sp.]